MKLVIATEKIVGKVLASSIYNANGNLFLGKGITVKPNHLPHFKRLGIHTLYIEDGNDDVSLQDMLDPSIKIKMMKALKKAFDSIEKTQYIEDEPLREIVNELIGNVVLSENAFLHNNIGHLDDSMKLVAHSLNVAVLAVVMGVNFQYPEERLQNLAIGALLHDVGRLFNETPHHVHEGYQLAKKNRYISPTATIAILQHHEFLDGSGVVGLKKDNIHEHSKIVTLCNEYINGLSSQNKVLPHLIMEQMTAQSAVKYDLELFKGFTNVVYCYPNGLELRLNNGVIGTVLAQNKGFPIRPLIVYEKDGQRNYINLTKELTVFVEEVVL